MDGFKKFSSFENWIPSVDADEVDIDKNYLRDIINADFHNGFISNAVAPTLVAYPPAIQTVLDDDWEIISYKYFYHSTQGHTYIAVLYKLVGGLHKLRFFVNSTELSIDEQNTDDYTISAKPTVVSYDLADDQFKINLNVDATYSFGDLDAKTVILNLTVCYLTERVYVNDDYERAAGWYIFPRWLAWTLEEGDVDVFYETESTAAFVEDCNDNTFLTHFNVGSIFTWSSGGFLPSFNSMLGTIGFYNDSTTDGKWGWINVDGLKQLKSIKFNWGTGFLINGYTHLKVGFTDSDVTTNPDSDASWIEIWNELLSSSSDHLLQKFEQEVNMVVEKDERITTASFKLWIGIGLPGKDSASAPYVNMRDIELLPIEGCIVAYNEDKQRNIVKKTFNVGLFDDPKISLPVGLIDWRITKFELYFNYGIYTLYKEVPVVNGSWVYEISTDSLEGTFAVVEDYPTVITTLNFNYGLGATVRVDEQKQIYSEAFYRNRVYFTKGDNKLYYSHISGTGLGQPDSFPYSEENLFGYMITDSNVLNKAVCITALDEIVIITEKNSYVYTIESVAGTPFRKIKAVNGGKGILSVNSLAVDFSGQAFSEILFWTNRWAVYGYTGGMEIPTSLTGLTHKRYWEQLADKETARTIYNKATNEYWIQIGNIIIIYELHTNTWKKYELDYTIKDFVGIVDNYTYILDSNDKLRKLDPNGSEILEAIIETHDEICRLDDSTFYKPTAEFYNSEAQMKILQNIYMSFKDAEVSDGKFAIVEIYMEDYLVSTIQIPMNYKIFTSNTDLHIGFGRIRFRITLPVTNTRSKFKEFGMWFTVSGLMENVDNVQEGYGQNVGQEYGIFG